MKKKYLEYVYIIILLTLVVLYLFNSNYIITNFINYTNLFIRKVMPSSFIFMVISSILIDYKLPSKITNTFHINGSIFYVSIMSMISGFPSGSKYIVDLYNKDLISLKNANYLILFNHYPNPIFVLGIVSNLFINKIYGVYILISLIFSNIIISFIFKPKYKDNIKVDNNEEIIFINSLIKSIINTSKVIILIYGISIFFYLIISIICKYISFNTYLYVFFNGLFDLTKGVISSSLINNDLIKAIFIIFFISTGGISINMQIKSIISDTKISYKYFLFGRLLQFIISIIIFCLFKYWIKYIN